MQTNKKTAEKSADGTRARATFLCRHHKTRLFKPVETDYDGGVPSGVWERLNRQFLKLDAGGNFFPYDGADAYHAAVYNVCAAAKKLSRGKIELKKDDEKYLTGVAFRSLAHFCNRVVMPMRTTYRAVERALVQSEERDGIRRAHDAPEGNDAGYAAYADAAENGAGAKCRPPTAQQLAENLSAVPSARERRLRAALALEDVYAAIQRNCPRVFKPQEIVRAFRAFVEADGNMLQAAHLAHVGVAWFYRLWPRWLKVAEKCVEKSSALWH